MIPAWIVVREEKHIDDKYWVCLREQDAMAIAKDVADYWIKEYAPEEDEIDTEPRGYMLFLVDIEDSACVYVMPTVIRDIGEVGAP